MQAATDADDAELHQGFNYRLAYSYIIGAAFWNFVGAGVFGGGTLNAPLTEYYEHGTFPTLNHAHTALFGVFGLLAIGLVYSACAMSRPGVWRSTSGWGYRLSGYTTSAW
ncbi:MAG TPA: hypothetical protein VFL55_04895 [Acetobacteraceae bacterium]|nr:hypothetical protein [Acetobacteraceae bacterium]